MKNILITRDSKGKIRVMDISCSWNEKLQAYVIIRNSSQLGGKITNQPIISIKRGKANRTVTEQAKLEYSSNLKKYLDKGYKDIRDFGFNSLDEFNADEVFPKTTTDANGAKKPMLAKKYDEVAISTFEKEHWCSKKLDGVRCMIRFEDGVVKTSSRGGGSYDIPAKNIINNEVLIDYLSKHNVILDGELYIHGKPLPYISGLCRKITFEDSHCNLQYHIYDVAGTDLKFKDRLNILDDLSDIFENEDCIVICEHIKTDSWTDVNKLHDKFVNEGYEGCVLRNPNNVYSYGTKTKAMIKVKKMDDDEYEILGMSEGLRDEDFVFVLDNGKGKKFEAKPTGDRALKQEYRKNIKNIIGKFGTVQHFGFTPDGIPNLPVFKYVRYGDDNN